MPKPVMNMYIAASNVDVCGDSRASRKRPTDRMAVPAIGKDTVAAGPRDDLTTDRRGDEQASHERQDVQARDGRRGALDHLEVRAEGR